MKYFGLHKMPIDTDITNFILKEWRKVPKLSSPLLLAPGGAWAKKRRRTGVFSIPLYWIPSQ